MMNGIIDLRSDTVTWPTPEMRQAMSAAPVGDDVYGDDPTVNELEYCAASMLGKEASVFVPSGTMGNQLALMVHAGRGDEVILSERCHIVEHEAGAAAILAGAQLRCLPVRTGRMELTAIEAAIRKNPVDIHSPRTALICLENADSDGIVLDIEYMRQTRALADHYGIPIHLDGARLFNAAIELQASAASLAALADTVQVCLSKGLCAPVGSVLAGRSDLIALARRKRKILGGGMRQAGILAAAGLIALRRMSCRLAEDHARARALSNWLSQHPEWFEIVGPTSINMVFFRLRAYPMNEIDFVHKLADRSILINESSAGVFRLVTHYWIDDADLTRLYSVLDELGSRYS